MEIRDTAPCVNAPTDEELLASGLTLESLDELSNNKGEDEE